MHDLLKSHFAALQSSIESTSLAEPQRLLITRSIEQLAALYTQYRETNSSRFGDDITRLVQTILRKLEESPETRELDAAFRKGLHDLHEELGIPKLPLKAAPAPPKTRKTAKK